METQHSIDLSYLKHYALSFVDEPSRLSTNGSASDRVPDKLKESGSARHGRSSLLASGIVSAVEAVNATRGSSLISASSSRPRPPSSAALRQPSPGRRRRDDMNTRMDISISDLASECGGDTQPVSDTEMDNALKRSHQAGLSGLNIFPFSIEYTETGITQKTLNEGDTGHLDLLADFEGENDSDGDGGEHDLDEVIADSPPTHYPAFPESQRFLQHTPAPARRTASGPNGEVETPSISRNPFTEGTKTPGSVMALTQLFNATQAPSSVMASSIARPRPEPSSDMPSPNIPIQPRFTGAVPTSPLEMMSSIRRAHLVEPQSNYVSLDESQAARAQRAQATTSDDRENASDDGLDEEDSILRKVRQRATENELGKQFATITAPARRDRVGRSRRTVSPSPNLDRRQAAHSSGRVLRADADEDVHLLPNGLEGESEEETEQEDEPLLSQRQGTQRPTSTGEEDKENFESGPVEVPNTATRAHDALSQALSIQNESTSENILADTPIPTEIHADSLPETSQRKADAVRINNSQSAHRGSQLSRRSQSGNPAFVDPDAAPLANRETSPTSSSPDPSIRSSPPARDFNSGIPIDHIDKTLPEELAATTSGAASVPGWRNAASKVEQPSESSRHPTPGGNSLLPPDSVNKHLPGSVRVPETPQNTQHKHTGQRTIPETSPTAYRGAFQLPSSGLMRGQRRFSSPTADDGELPPIPARSATGHRTRRHLSRVPKESMSDPVSAIFSSPSGRQRQKMTEIAMDMSPRPAVPDVSLADDFGLFTAEDKEFQALTADQELHPPKKRKVNNGRAINAPIRMREHKPTEESAEDDNATSKATSKATTPMETDDAQVNVRKAIPREPTGIRSRKEGSSRSISRGSSKRSGEQMIYAVVIDRSDPTSAPPRPAKSETAARSDEIIPSSMGSVHGLGDGQPLFSNRVIAFFNGSPKGYFPATCVGVATGPGRFRYRIDFEDSNPPDEIEPHNLKRLELRVDDVVKLVQKGVLNKAPYIVVGFADRVDRVDTHDPNAPAPVTDIYGHRSVLVRPRPAQTSPRGRPPRPITVPVSDIYFDKALWSRLGDRPFTFVPEEGGPTPELEASLKTSRFRGQLTRSLSRCDSERNGLFSNMVFAVSYKDKEKQQELETLIAYHGGRTLEHGFDELFELPSPASTSDRMEKGENLTGASALELVHGAKHTGFACLITDQFSRRPKYVQALALNLPCLAGRWVDDCIAEDRVLDWELYLLAAGTSGFLGGAVKSRILAPNPPTTARLSSMVDARAELLANQSVLFITDRGKAAKEREPYRFLIHVLGPSRISHVQDLGTALQMLAEDQQEDSGREGWDCVYAGDEKAAAVARQKLVDLSRSGGSKQGSVRGRGRPKKQQKSPVDTASTTDIVVVGGRKVRILDNEYLCQSLILGRLLP